jgi:hypothetical protein
MTNGISHSALHGWKQAGCTATGKNKGWLIGESWARKESAPQWREEKIEKFLGCWELEFEPMKNFKLSNQTKQAFRSFKK